MPKVTLDSIAVDASKLAVRDWLTAELARLKQEVNHPLIIAASRQLAAGGKAFPDIKIGYWPLHNILRTVHVMTGLDHDKLPGGDLVEAVRHLLAVGVLTRISYRDKVPDWRDYDCYRVAADY